MSNVFEATTKDGYYIKILSELMHNNLKFGCFEIDSTGIKSSMIDLGKTVLFNLQLHANKFNVYKFKSSTKLSIGINLNHFYLLTKSIKKKDTVSLFISEANKNELGIKVISKENGNSTTSYVAIQKYQTLEIEVPTGYSKSVIISSSEYQKMIKSLGHIHDNVTISSKQTSVCFSSESEGIVRRTSTFGEVDSDDDEDDENEFNDVFDIKQLVKISKICNLSSNIQLFIIKDNPLLFKSDIGYLGQISIYLKSKRQVECQQNDGIDK